MIKKYIIVFILILLLVGGMITFHVLTTPKIAYVRSAELVNKYAGMKEASLLYKDKMAKWQANIDTLEADYQRSIGKYNLQYASLSSAQRKEQELLLGKQHQNIQQYAKTLDEKAQEEDNKMTAGVINQVNTFIEDYGKKNGYDFILGTTQQGNILYGNQSKDITDEILNELNKHYKSEAK